MGEREKERELKLVNLLGLVGIPTHAIKKELKQKIGVIVNEKKVFKEIERWLRSCRILQLELQN